MYTHKMHLCKDIPWHDGYYHYRHQYIRGIDFKERKEQLPGWSQRATILSSDGTPTVILRITFASDKLNAYTQQPSLAGHRKRKFTWCRECVLSATFHYPASRRLWISTALNWTVLLFTDTWDVVWKSDRTIFAPKKVYSNITIWFTPLYFRHF